MHAPLNPKHVSICFTLYVLIHLSFNLVTSFISLSISLWLATSNTDPSTAQPPCLAAPTSTIQLHPSSVSYNQKLLITPASSSASLHSSSPVEYSSYSPESPSQLSSSDSSLSFQSSSSQALYGSLCSSSLPDSCPSLEWFSVRGLWSRGRIGILKACTLSGRIKWIMLGVGSLTRLLMLKTMLVDTSMASRKMQPLVHEKLHPYTVWFHVEITFLFLLLCFF